MTVASSVYWIHHPDHTDMFSQGYIGVSINVERRFNEHLKKSDNRHLRFAIGKYGWDTLIKKQILIADENYCLDIERKLRPNDGIGWNLVMGGGLPPKKIGNKYRLGKPSWNKGKKMSAETRAKVSKAAKEQWGRLGMRELLSNAKKGKPSPRKGVKLSEETKRKIGLIHLGKPSKKKGIPVSAEAIEKLKKTLHNNPWVCVHCGKIGLNKGTGTRWHFDNCKEKKSCQSI